MVSDLGKEAIELHKKFMGKIAVKSLYKVADRHTLALAYTPGVADVSLHVRDHPETAFDLTCKGRLACVVSDGTRVLGLGDIGPLGALPVMEGKCMLLKSFGNVDAVPLCLDTKNEDEIVAVVKAIAPSFGAILLEDFSSPKCFAIEKRLESMLDVPVFHDDQHGTAIVALAGLINALKLTAREDKKSVKIVISGCGAAGVAIARLFHAYGFRKISIADSKGAVCRPRSDLEEYKKELLPILEPSEPVSLKQLLAGADVFVGASAPNILKAEDIKTMAEKPIVFALSNPTPEISPEAAQAGGAFIYGSGRSDLPNQINNALGFPGIFRGLLDCRAKRVSMGMKLAAAQAIAKLAQKEGLSAQKIVPDPFDKKLAKVVAKAVMKAAKKEGLARA
ncbi:NAD-dependent malic enzyme [uncultured archaeon]|nr:NAD-dependent malic enzyme [uncultured archaeon]